MEALHPLALNGLLWLVRISWQVSVLIAFVLLVQRLFHGRMTPAWRHALWLLVAARLLLPASLESRMSVFNWLRLGEPAVTSRPMRAVTPVALTGPALQAISAASPSTAAAPPTPTPAVPPGIFPAHAKLVLEEAETKAAAQVGDERTRGKIILWLAALWLAGVLVLSARVRLESVRLQRIIAPKRLVTDSAVLELLEDCKQLMGVRVPVVLVQTEFISSPVLYGFLRPRLLLPAGLLKDFSRAELRFVFLHELAHVRRHDIALSWLMSALQVLHWFNPLVWIAFQRMKADRELACDALVLSRTQDSEQKAYGRTMLRLLESFVRPTRFPAMAGILEDPSQLATRIRCIAAFNRRTPSPAFALGAALVLALVALTDQRVAAAAHGAAGWPARFLMTRDGGETDMRAVLLRPLAGVDMEKALAQGRLCIAPAADSTNLLQDGYEPIGVVDGLGLDRWQPHSKRGALSARAAHSMVWTGRELLVWGGGAMDIFKQSGAAYNPDTDTWRFLSTNGAPSGRWHHAAQWTGKEMIIWGGRANFYAKDNFNDGARYDPETDTWRPMNSKGAPEARSQMMSVWTGHEFIVWGGRGDRGAADYDRPFNDGARYHPDTDSWTPMSECPLNGRYDAVSVWTGRELIVWGGAVRVPPVFLAAVPNLLTYGDGARYDPALDQWTLLPQEGALSARYKHTAVWTGTEMIIWGGAQYPSAVNFHDGARFNPATGRWTPLAQQGTPSDRSCHLAAWDGAEMIVWGGATIGGECFNTGGRYDPVQDRWTPLTLNNAPVPRYMQRPDAGVWTGRQLLVFGGYDYNIEFGVSAGWSPAPAMHLYQRAR